MVSRPTGPSAMAIAPSSTKDLKSSPTLPLLHLHLPAQPHHHHHRGGSKRRSPLRALASSAVAASIGRPFRSCRRRLAKLFARLTASLRRAGAPTIPKRQHHHPKLIRRRLFLLDPTPTHVAPTSPAPLPPLPDPTRRTVFLDLDETLVHSSTDRPGPAGPSCDFVVRPVIDGHALTFYVRKRPGVDEFLAALSAAPAGYEVVVFTAGLREYASLVLDRLDPNGTVFAHRLYRDSCREAEGGRLTKDLSVVGRDLARVVLVDDNPNSYVFQPGNALPVAPFLDDPNDRELRRVRRFFEEVLPLFEDAREALKWFRSQPDDSDGGLGGQGPAGEKKTTTAAVDITAAGGEQEQRGDDEHHEDEDDLDITFTSSQKGLVLQGQLLWGLPAT